MSSLQIRGSEAKIQISVDGQLQKGSFANVQNFKLSPKFDIKDVNIVGEKVTKHNLQFQDHDFSFSVLEEDAACAQFLQKLISNFNAGIAPPLVNITVTHTYLDGVTVWREVLEVCTIYPEDRDLSSRTDFVKWSFKGKCERVTAI